ncbi:MAG: hypothetical protein WC588_01660 [Candidatus Micrarchaeia archaeon]
MEKLRAAAVALVAVLAVVAFYPVLFPPGAQQRPGNVSEAVFTPFVEGCATEGEAAKEREGKRGEASGEEAAAAISVDGNSVSYARAASHYCCLSANVSGEIEEGKITIVENWGGSPCRCMCFSKLGANFSEIPSGDYLVEAYLTDTEGRKLLLSQKVGVG